MSHQKPSARLLTSCVATVGTLAVLLTGCGAADGSSDGPAAEQP